MKQKASAGQGTTWAKQDAEVLTIRHLMSLLPIKVLLIFCCSCVSGVFMAAKLFGLRVLLNTEPMFTAGRIRPVVSLMFAL